MTSSVAMAGREQPRLAALGLAGAFAALAVAPSVILVYRHASPLLAVILAYCLTIPLFWSSPRWAVYLGTLRQASRSLEARLALGFAVLCLASAALSPVGPKALESAAEMVAGLGLVVLIAVAARQLEDDRLMLFLLAGAALGAALLIGDLVSQHRHRAMIGVMTRATDSNRAAVFAALVAPLAFHAVQRAGLGRLLGALALPLIFVGCYLSHSTSAKLALASGLAVYIATVLGGRRFVTLAGAIVAGSIILMPLLAGSVHRLAPEAVYRTTEKESFEPRALIWEAYARLTLNKPMFGHGFETSQLAEKLPEAAGFSEATRRALGNLHPHNAPLQVWFELGAVGAVLAALLAWLAFRRIANAPPTLRPSAAALAASVYAVAIVSHGAWQVWWPMMIGIVIAGLPFAARPHGAQARTASDAV